MQCENWDVVINAVNCYDDQLLHEAQQFYREVAAHDFWRELVDTTAFTTAIAASEKEHGTEDYWQHDNLRKAIESYIDEDYSSMLLELSFAMIKRSSVYELAYM